MNFLGTWPNLRFHQLYPGVPSLLTYYYVGKECRPVEETPVDPDLPFPRTRRPRPTTRSQGLRLLMATGWGLVVFRWTFDRGTWTPPALLHPSSGLRRTTPTSCNLQPQTTHSPKVPTPILAPHIPDPPNPWPLQPLLLNFSPSAPLTSGPQTSRPLHLQPPPWP